MSFFKRLGEKVSRANLFVHRGQLAETRRNRAFELVWERAAEQSADFIMSHMQEAVIHRGREDFWRYVLRNLPSTGQLLEVGVFQGVSINFIADDRTRRRDARLVHGFDSFEGLEEDWAGESLPAGFFDQKGKLPDVRSNVRLHKGWVQDTLGPFLDTAEDRTIALLHIDTDTYTPARFTLEAAKPFLVPGSVIVFDELIGYPNWQEHEYRALMECLDEKSYRYIGFTSRQAAIRMV